MRKIWVSVVLSVFLITILGFTVYSQQTSTTEAESDSGPVIQLLQGGVEHHIPLDITMLLASDTGVQTVTVPVTLKLDLSIGPVEAIDIDVNLSETEAFVSPLTIVEPVPEIDASAEITETDVLTDTDEEKGE
ncbi:MAG: hypothetical protein AAF639_41695 [Chloroflexota bacterium]